MRLDRTSQYQSEGASPTLPVMLFHLLVTRVSRVEAVHAHNNYYVWAQNLTYSPLPLKSFSGTVRTLLGRHRKVGCKCPLLPLAE
jgi:hypothetical protein